MAAHDSLTQPLTLPCGSTLSNRLAKSALSETMGTVDNHVTPDLVRLYRRWAQGGSGLLLTGNIMVDRRYLGEPHNVVIEDEQDLPLLRQWAAAGALNGCQTWVQLNHPGKQMPRMLARGDTLSASAVPFSKQLQAFFKTPRAASEAEIAEIIARFARAAGIAKRAGFAGVQIHGAHGYLVSQFLSPHHNRRQDRWGGSLENRMRFPLELYRAIRAQVGDDYPVGIKLNSADFQRGGFTEAESMTVAQALSEEGLDLLEISGGSYESPAMAGKNVKASTLAREAYFLDYAEQIRARTAVPLMVTGGFRTAQGMAEAVSSGATDLVGLGRPLAVEPDLPARILAGEACTSVVKPRTTGIKALDDMAMMEIVWFTRQLQRMGEGKNPLPNEPVLLSMVRNMSRMGLRGARMRLRA